MNDYMDMDKRGNGNGNSGSGITQTVLTEKQRNDTEPANLAPESGEKLDELDMVPKEK